MSFLRWRRTRIPSDPHFRANASVETCSDNKFKVYPRALNITWGNDRRYWTIPGRDPNNYDKDENYFAELKQVCWLEVTGSIKKDLVPGKTYKASFGVSLSPDAFGWDDCSVYIMAKIGKKGHFHLKKMNLTTIPTTSTDVKISFIPTPGDDLIVQVPLTQPDDDLNLYFGLYEVWTNRWKGGLRIHYALVEMVIHNDTAIPITTQ
ncbi:hypothetical protein IC575_028786 [Cucumis melo]|uniref:Protein PHLOEM PROTEIN 2-LIKE A9-like n=1 Tax=Cucumis melo TaxID=3656 RepID=A0A1S3C8T6_CUCME|nr:protein PHLOEM PROTEIN 2-LIKE A9-like [Cucumis melo]